MTHDNVTDIVERLDELAGLCDRHVIPHAGHAAICRQAADTIATLRKQLENARSENAKLEAELDSLHRDISMGMYGSQS